VTPQGLRRRILIVADDDREGQRLVRWLDLLGAELFSEMPAGREEAELILVQGEVPSLPSRLRQLPVARLLPRGVTTRNERELPSDLSPAELRERIRRLLGEGGYDAICREAADFLETGRNEEALSSLSLAVSTAPARPEAFHLIGKLMEKDGSPFEAQENYATALVLDPRYAPAREALVRLEKQKES
jgi:tetratricopeptide (TPR) repeat protein